MDENQINIARKRHGDENVSLFKNRRAVSPIIAAILLIGLTVLAGFIIVGVVLPLLSSSPEIKVVNDTEYVAYKGGFRGLFKVTLMNAGTAIGEVTSTSVEYYSDSSSSWKPVLTYPSDTFPYSISSLNNHEFFIEFDSNESLNKNENYRVSFRLPGNKIITSDSGAINKLRDASMSGEATFSYATGKGTASGISIFNNGQVFTSITDIRVISNMTNADTISTSDKLSIGVPKTLNVGTSYSISIPFSTIDVDENGLSGYYFEVDVEGMGTFSTEDDLYVLTNPGFEFQNAIWQDNIGSDGIIDRVRLDIATSNETVPVTAVYVYAILYNQSIGGYESSKISLPVGGDNGSQVLTANSAIHLYITFTIQTSLFPGSGVMKFDAEIDLPSPKSSLFASGIGDEVIYTFNNTPSTTSYSKTVTTDNVGPSGKIHLGCQTTDFEIQLSNNYDLGATREDLDADNLLDGINTGSNGWLATSAQGSAGTLHFNITFRGTYASGAWVSSIYFYFDGTTSWGRVPSTMRILVDGTFVQATWVPNANGYYVLSINRFGKNFTIFYPTIHAIKPDGATPSYGPHTNEVSIYGYSAFKWVLANTSKATTLSNVLTQDDTGPVGQVSKGCYTADYSVLTSHVYINDYNREDLDADQIINAPTPNGDAGALAGNSNGWLVDDSQGDSGVHCNITLRGSYSSGVVFSSIALYFDSISNWGENPKYIYLVLDNREYIWVNTPVSQNLQGNSYILNIGRFAKAIMICYYSNTLAAGANNPYKAWDDGNYGFYTTGILITTLGTTVAKIPLNNVNNIQDGISPITTETSLTETKIAFFRAQTVIFSSKQK